MGEEHYKVARGVQEVLQKYKELQDIIAMLGMDELSEGISLPFPCEKDSEILIPAVLRGRTVYRSGRPLRSAC